MVLPENMSMCRSLVDIGLTTISSVWNTQSTTMPKVWLPTCVTTMKPFSGSVDEPSSIFRSFFRCISGKSLLRRRRTAVSLMRSMRCSELARARTSSTTDNFGIAKRSPPASTISAETMASVSGILMVTEDPSPATDLISMVPPIWSILVRTTSMPTPRPETEVMAAAVEKPGAKMNLWIWASLIFSSSASVTRPEEMALALIFSVLSPRPLSAMQMMMWPPS